MGRIVIKIRVYDNRWNTLAKDEAILPVTKQAALETGVAAKNLMLKMIRKAKEKVCNTGK